MTWLRTRRIPDDRACRAFFDALAPAYAEAHGAAAALLAYRLGLIRRLLGDVHGTLLEIGCGTGIHLFALSERFDRAIGIDFSLAMIEEAQRRLDAGTAAGQVELRVDDARVLDTVADASVDAVLCVGALEHVPDQPAVLRQARRVLRRGGVLVCLTPNGGWWWYRLAVRLGIAVHHLSGDRFAERRCLESMARAAGLQEIHIEAWSFIPRGDVPGWLGWLLAGLDRCGCMTGIGALRGGLALRAVRR